MSQGVADFAGAAVGGVIGYIIGGPLGAVLGAAGGDNIANDIWGALNPQLPAGVSTADTNNANSYFTNPTTNSQATGSPASQVEQLNEAASATSLAASVQSYNQSLEGMAVQEAGTESAITASAAARGIKIGPQASVNLNIPQYGNTSVVNPQTGTAATSLGPEEPAAFSQLETGLEGSALAQLVSQATQGRGQIATATNLAQESAVAASESRQAGIGNYELSMLQAGQNAANQSTNDWLGAFSTLLNTASGEISKFWNPQSNSSSTSGSQTSSAQMWAGADQTMEDDTGDFYS